MVYQACLFDLDGTLLNTLEDICDAMNRALIKNNLSSKPLEAYRYFVGSGAEILAQRASAKDLTGMPEAQANKITKQVLADYLADYKSNSDKATRPYDGIIEVLKALNKRQIFISILSNKPHSDTLYVTSHYFSDIGFAAVRGQQPGVAIKPNPQGALEIAQAIHIPPENFLYIGDTGVDMVCAARAGMTSIGVTWGFRPETELIDSGAKYIIDTPSQIIDIIDSPAHMLK